MSLSKVSAQGTASDRVTAWRVDLDSLVTRITRVHPRPWAHRTRAAFPRDAAELRASLGRRSDGEILAGMMRLAASLSDGHTSITDLGPAGGKWFPYASTSSLTDSG